jgi:type III pantothenate kinase
LVSNVLGEDYAVKLGAWVEDRFGVKAEFALSQAIGNGVVNGYRSPETLGVDRWLGILAAKNHVAGSFVLVDCGSAITVDLVNARGEHLGGYIAPGLRLLRTSLNTNTVGLKFENLGAPVSDQPGTDTESAILSAEFIMIKALVETAKLLLGQITDDVVELIVTGGDGQWLVRVMSGGRFQEDLVLEGLAIALNKGDPSEENQ